MKRAVIICGIFCLLSHLTAHSQGINNMYEYEMDRLLAGANPEYYFALKKVLSDYEENLILNGAIADGSYESYRELLNEIAKDKDFKPDVSYDLEGSLQNLGDGIRSVFLSIEASVIASKYLKPENSKNFYFNTKVSELIEDNTALDRSKMAALLLEVYEEEDFKLPMLKLKILKFLDPNYDLIVHSYIGRPTRD